MPQNHPLQSKGTLKVSEMLQEKLWDAAEPDKSIEILVEELDGVSDIVLNYLSAPAYNIDNLPYKISAWYRYNHLAKGVDETRTVYVENSGHTKYVFDQVTSSLYTDLSWIYGPTRIWKNADLQLRRNYISSGIADGSGTVPWTSETYATIRTNYYIKQIDNSLLGSNYEIQSYLKRGYIKIRLYSSAIGSIIDAPPSYPVGDIKSAVIRVNCVSKPSTGTYKVALFIPTCNEGEFSGFAIDDSNWAPKMAASDSVDLNTGELVFTLTENAISYLKQAIDDPSGTSLRYIVFGIRFMKEDPSGILSINDLASLEEYERPPNIPDWGTNLISSPNNEGFSSHNWALTNSVTGGFDSDGTAGQNLSVVSGILKYSNTGALGWVKNGGIYLGNAYINWPGSSGHETEYTDNGYTENQYLFRMTGRWETYPEELGGSGFEIIQVLGLEINSERDDSLLVRLPPPNLISHTYSDEATMMAVSNLEAPNAILQYLAEAKQNQSAEFHLKKVGLYKAFFEVDIQATFDFSGITNVMDIVYEGSRGEVTTQTPTDVEDVVATFEGQVTNVGTEDYVKYGFYWKQGTGTPTASDNNTGMLGIHTLDLVDAGSFTVGYTYEIVVVGSTDFTSIGASSNAVGIVFVASGVGSGTGNALRRKDFSYTASGLSPSTTYTYVAWIEGTYGITTGGTQQFTTASEPPPG